jgi:hypothetical protein
MNIFFLDRDPIIAAKYACGSHVCKMVLESVQILSTAHWIADCSVAEALYSRSAIYAPTHPSHPSVLWAARSLSNWRWLRRHCFALSDERLWRFPNYNRHKSTAVAHNMPEPGIADPGLTEFAIGFKSGFEYPSDTVMAYRLYYRQEKSHLAIWTRRGAPAWWRPAPKRSACQQLSAK